MFAAAYEDPPRVWGVGRVVVGEAVTPWPVAESEIDAEAQAAAPRLADLGLADGGLMLLVSLLSQAIHVVPLERAAGLVGALYSSADATAFDAIRTASLVRRLQPSLVVGIDSAVLDGFDALDADPADVLRAVPVVLSAEPAATARLRAAGLAPRGWAKLGPTSAFQSLDDDRFVVDAERWLVEEGDGELLITSRGPRVTPCVRLRTGVPGRVVGDGDLLLEW